MRKSIHIFMIAAITACFLFALSGAASAANKEIVSTLKHKEAGVKCIDCHGTNNPKTMPNHSACIKCHDSGNGYYAGEKRTYMNGGKPREFNMHNSHVGPVRCTVCHTVHKEPGKIYCNWCHQIDVKAK